MNKKIITLLILGIFLLSNISLISASEINNKIKDINETENSPINITEKFFFAKVKSTGNPIFWLKGSTRYVVGYNDDLDKNHTTTITSLFGKRSITLKGNHTLTIIFPSRFGLIEVPDSSGNINIDCRAFIVKISYQITT
jgi:hypothetical protein